MTAISNFFNPNRKWAVDLALLVLRAGTGLLLLPHGLGKFEAFDEKASTFYNFLNLGSEVSMGLTIFGELLCSILLTLGLGTRLVLIPLMIMMLVIVFGVHGEDPLGDKEHGLLYLLSYFALFLLGPGRISLDQLIFGKKQVM
ncbi:MAG TPA: DoxX family membrane protein [Saprospiraceae bacterium]|nr:DoxX family membrane protein [Saprospiraceae bacterium]